MAYMNLRSHRKLLTIDGRIAFTGGMNISESNLLKINPQNPCEDVQFQLLGPVVRQIQETFALDWIFTTQERLEGEVWFPKLAEIGSSLARGIPDGPDEDFEKCRWTILGALGHARKNIRIATPYLIPDRDIVTALNLAAMRGVRVDIALPESNDMRLVHWATQAILWQVLERGCHVWMTPPPFNHSKLMMMDGMWMLLGSTNWDPRSLRLNFEFNVECYDQPLTNQMEKLFDDRISKGRELTLAEVDSRPIPEKIRDGVARLFSPLL
jgi:cardiolipin synthase